MLTMRGATKDMLQFLFGRKAQTAVRTARQEQHPRVVVDSTRRQPALLRRLLNNVRRAVARRASVAVAAMTVLLARSLKN